jgi:ketosteroid isomerase-like protein/quercetin dioxygenase-like cupin family protein
MKKNNFLSIPVMFIAFSLTVSTLLAQDPVHADAKHYKVVAENKDLRVLRIKYGPGEKSVMHFHPESAVVFMTDIKGEFTLADGSTMKTEAKAGDVALTPAGKHLPHIGNKAIEVIQVELKSNGTGNISLAKSLYEAFAKGDIPTVLAGLDSTIVWNEAENFPYADKNPYVGKDAVLNGVFARIGGEWDNFSLTEKQFFPIQNDMILVTGYYTGKHKQTGKTIKAQFAHVWWMKDGKLVKFQQYADTKQVADAVKN